MRTAMSSMKGEKHISEAEQRLHALLNKLKAIC